MTGLLLRASYGRSAWRRLLFVVVSVPLGVVGFGYAVVVVVPGMVLSLTLIGLPWLATGLIGARWAGRLHRSLAGRLLGERVEPPPELRPAPGRTGWIRSAVADPAGWRMLVYQVVKLPVAVIAFVTCVVVWGHALLYLGYVGWELVAAVSSLGESPSRRLLLLTGPSAGSALGVGALALLVAPWVTRGGVLPDRLLVRALLGPTRAGPARPPPAGTDGSAAALRRIERDLHDGAQAQLVSLAMQLGLAREELRDGDTTAALDRVDAAREGAKQALAELRDLARGILPTVLDRGLAAALQALASRSAVPVQVHVDLRARPAAVIEATVYFTATELLANVAKHSGARWVEVNLVETRAGWLELTVLDDGVGGAVLADGVGGAQVNGASGLSGLMDRIGAVNGRMELVSPRGGPTVVRVELPVEA